VVTTQPTFDVPATTTTPGTNAVFMNGPITTGTAVFTPNATQQEWTYQEITTACQRSDLVISYHHNHAFNDTWAIDAWWQNMTHAMIDSGTSIYLSNGAQNIRGIEVYKGAIIAYSNGNAIFESQGHSSPMNAEGYILDTCFDGRTTEFLGARIIPTLILNGTGTIGSAEWNATAGVPTLSTGATALQTLQTLQNLSSVFNTTITIETLGIGYVGYIRVNGFVPPAETLKCKRTRRVNHQSDENENGNGNDGNGNGNEGNGNGNEGNGNGGGGR